MKLKNKRKGNGGSNDDSHEDIIRGLDFHLLSKELLMLLAVIVISDSG